MDRFSKETEKAKLLDNLIQKNPDLLCTYAENGDTINVELMIQCGANVNYKKGNDRAVDLAWNNSKYEVVWILLKNDSVFPKNFDEDKLSNDEFQGKIKKLVTKRKEFHELIANGDLEKDEEKIENYIKSNKLKLYLNENNESAAHTAIKNGKYQIYGFLRSKGANFKNDYEVNIIKHLPAAKKHDLELKLKPFSFSPPQAHLDSMWTKSLWQHQIENPEKVIKNYYEALCQIAEIKIIFDVLKYVEFFSLNYDFERKDVVCICPTSAQSNSNSNSNFITTGITSYKERKICIAAHPDRGEHKILGTIAHELTHMLMHVLYDNGSNPYRESQEERKDEFDKIKKDIGLRMKNNAFTGDESKNLWLALQYEPPEVDSELIVRVPEILAEYKNGRTWLKSNVPDLFKFYHEHIISNCEEYVKESFLLKPKTEIRCLNESKGEINEIKELNLYFKESELKFKTNTIPNGINLITTENIRFTTIKVLQSLYSSDYIDRYDSYLILRFNILRQTPLPILQTFMLEASKTLIIECYQDEETHKAGKLFFWLNSLLISKPHKQIIFVATKSDSYHFKKCLKDNKLKVIEFEDTPITLYDLAKNSQTKILQKPFIFSGSVKTLENLFGENNEELLKSVDSDSILELYKETKVRIGSYLLRSADLEGAYADFVKEVEDLKNLLSFMSKAEMNNSIFIFNAIKGLKLNFDELKIIDSNFKTFKEKDFQDVISQNDPNQPKKCLITITDNLTMVKFKQMSHKYIESKIYWINVENNEGKFRFFLQQFYNPKFYLDRKFIFLKKLIINGKVVQELTKNDLQEFFIFSELDQNALIRLYKCSDSERENLKNNCQAEKVLFFEKEDDARSKFEENKALNHTTHWLKLEGNDIVWSDSSGSLNILRPYFDENKEYEIEENNLINEIEHKKIVIIADDPGMGKSTSLTKLYEFNSIYEKHWIIRLNLKDHLEKIKQLSLKKITDINFLLADSDSVLSRRLLEFTLAPGNIAIPLIIAFDGFDELLDETDRRTIINLMKVLKDKPSCKIWITTRVDQRDILGNELTSLVIRFVPFDDSLKKEFIKNYLKDRFYLFNKKLEQEFERKNIHGINVLNGFLNAMTSIFGREWASFIGTPLQLHLMLECYIEDFQKFNEKTDTEINWNDKNILEIYRKFVTKKYDIFFKKINCETSALSLGQWKTILNQYNKDLAKVLALEFEENKFLDKFKRIALLLGLTRSLSEKLEFVHPTFRDYFAAKVFLGWMKKRKTKTNFVNDKKLQYLFKNALVNPSLKLTRNFMSLKLKNTDMNKFSEEDIKYFVSEASNILTEWGSNHGNKETFLDVIIKEDNVYLLGFIIKVIKKADHTANNYLCKFLDLKHSSGQSLLFHICEKKSNGVFELMLKQVLEKYNLLDIKDDFQRTCVHCAVINDNLESLEILFKAMSKQEQIVILKMKDSSGKTPLHYAANLHREEIMSFLLKKIKEIEETEEATDYCYDLLCLKDDLNRTPLHIASESGNANIMTLILDKLENLNPAERFLDALCMVDESFKTPILCTSSYQKNKTIVELMQDRINKFYKTIDQSKSCEKDQTLLKFQYLLSKSFFDITIITFFETTELSVLIRENRNDLLLTAAKKGKEDIVKFLIKCGADLNYSDGMKNSAPDYAWKSKSYSVLLTLLKADSFFPQGFSLTGLNEQFQDQKDLKDFVEERNKLHNSIKVGNENEVVKLTASRSSKLYLSIENKSAIFVSFESKKFDIYKYLKIIGCELRKEESINDDIDIPENSKPYILHLLSVSKSTKSVENFYDEIKPYYESLYLIPNINIPIILKVVQCANNLKITFDFKENETPSRFLTQEKSRGQNYCIFICTKNHKNVILGQLIHEFTHLATQLVFQNNSHPYDAADEKSKALFQNIKQTINDISCTKIQDREIHGLFLDIFKKPYHSDLDAEIIATVSQILVQYTGEGQQWLEANLPDLYPYYEKSIILKCKEIIKSRRVTRPIDYIQSLGENKDFKNYNINFKSVFPNDNLFGKSNVLIFKVENTLLGTIKMLQMLFGNDYITLNTYLTFKFEGIMGHLGEIMIFFKSEDVDHLIVRFSSNFCDLTKLEELCSILSTILEEKPQKKVAFVVPFLKEEADLSKKVREVICISKTVEVISDDNLSLFDLNEKSQKMVLEKQILFQGRDMRLLDLVNSNECLHKLIKGDIMNNLLLSNKVIVGNEILNSNSLHGAYISIFQKADVQFFIHNIIKERSDHIFLIYGLGKSRMKGEFMDVLSKVATIDIDQDYLNRLIDEIDPGKYKLSKNSNKRLLLTSHSVSEAYFKKFCKDNPVCTIYLIETNTNDKVNPFTLQILYNPNFYLSRKFKKTSHQPNSSNSRQFRESDLRQEIAKEKKVVVLVGGPGSGKTTSLTKLYDDELIAGNYWIIRINVSEHLKEIQNLDCTNLSIERVVKFLQRIEPKLKDELLKELLETALNVDKEFAKRLLIVFDELDALSHDDDKKKTILLLKFLMDKTSSALWIATTQNCLEKLEQELSVSAIELLPMDYDLNIIFIQNYLRDRVKLTPMQSKFDGAKQSGKLLEKVESCFSADLSYLRGNLSVLIMAMEIFLDYLKRNPVENLDGLQIDNIAGFCERFIHLKLDIFKSKNKLEKYSQGREMEMLEQQLNSVAELIIFEQPFDKILDYDLSLTTGIVRLKGGSLKFIQGFLEDFYVAKTFIYWICNNMKSISVGKKNKITLETILMILEESENRKIRIFINFLLQNIDLESDKNKCTYFIIAKIFDECSEKEQYLNKTALHVAIEEKNYQIFRFLFSYSNKELHEYETLLKITDSRNQTLLSYSAINGCFEIFKLLLSEIQRLPLPEQGDILRKETENGSILNEAAINGHSEIVELVLKERKAPFEIQRELLMKKTKNQTALSLAVSKNHLTVVKELLEKSKILLSENDRKFLLTMTYDLNQTILHITVENGSYGVLELLLKHLKPLLNNELHNFFITKKNNDQTILHLAAEKGHLEIVRLLLDSEPTSYSREFILVPDKNNETVFHLAIKRNFFSIFYFILEKGNEVLTLQEQQDFRTMASENINIAFSLAVSQNNMAQLKKWFEDGDEQLSLQTQHNLLLMVYDSGKTALNVAVENNYLDLTEYLFEKARKVLNREDLIAFFTSGVNNLFLAEITKDLMLVDLILKKGDNILSFDKLIDFMKVSNALNSPSEGIRKLVLKTIQYGN